MSKYDLVVIGGGAAGLTAAAGAASMGAKVALIEKNSLLGGDCLHYGCVPSKALITSAKAVHQARKSAAEFGLLIEGEADIAVAMDRVRQSIETIQHHDSHERFEGLGIDVITGAATFVNEHKVKVTDGTEIEGKRFVIATGSSPFIPQVEGIDRVDYLTNETIFKLKQAPKRMAVIGGGAIGLELSQSISRFGTDVTVIERHSRLFAREEEQIAETVQNRLEQELSFHFNSSLEKVDKQNDEIVITVKNIDTNLVEHLTVDALFMSAGRKPNIETLGLENAGVKTEKGYVVVNEYLQTSQSHIFAVGDVNGAMPFTHVAGMEGKLIVQNAVFGIKKKVSYKNVPYVIFTDPEVFHLGLTETEARAKYGDENIKVYQKELNDVDRFVADRDTEGLVKVITDKKGHILGAHAVGSNAGDWMQEIVFAMTNGNKIGDLSNVIHPYPTHGAALQQTADMYWREKLFNGKIPAITEKYIKWFR
ncbi:dihydrolipoyl dehydrogenase family protein [Bacillus solimangrovi]|uniref:Pyridine nucleotide-disulfide oxidoreductase n=1 Tax=Bacillus solimangrovi TaxID=1305675 RepID=A0A1E5LDS3_9BACI|nr:FAD-dependent oxidoreductase [Bacillus solimangrovi]OEH92226.1 pyridine nucleotide-disulfide oxidoreductase [Bacillus solimangrovi]